MKFVAGYGTNIEIIGENVDDHIDMVKRLSVYPEIIEKQHDLKIVLHLFMVPELHWFQST